MRLFLRHIGLLSLVLSFCACSSLGTQPQRPYDVEQQLVKVATSFDPTVVQTCEEKPSEVCRDRIVRNQIEAYNIVFGQFEDAISKVTQQVHITGDILVSLFTGAGTVIKGTQAKSIVSALASSVTGAKNTVDTNLLFQKSVTTVTSRMEALRKEALNPIRAGLLKPLAEYSLTQALLDVEEYFKAGSMQRAIASIDEATEEKNSEADDAKNEMLQLTYGADENTTLLRNFWKPDGKVSSENAADFQKWIDENVSKGLSKTAFLTGQRYADARKKAVAELINKEEE
jgi:hypothetical protein